LRSKAVHDLAADAAGALQVSEAHPGGIDLLVTDLTLAGGDGTRLAEALRQLRPGLRVLFLSGDAEADLLGRGLLPPGARFLQKPFAVADLEAEVQEVLAGPGK